MSLVMTFLDWYNGPHKAKRITEKFYCTITNKTGSNYAEIETCKNYNGSGKTAFGGAKEWMALDIRIALPVETTEKDGQSLLHDMRMLLNKHGYN